MFECASCSNVIQFETKSMDAEEMPLEDREVVLETVKMAVEVVVEVKD